MQQSFRSHVLSLVETINDVKSIFNFQSDELFTLGTGNIVNESMVETVCTIEQL